MSSEDELGGFEAMALEDTPSPLPVDSPLKSPPNWDKLIKSKLNKLREKCTNSDEMINEIIHLIEKKDKIFLPAKFDLFGSRRRKSKSRSKKRKTRSKKRRSRKRN